MTTARTTTEIPLLFHGDYVKIKPAFAVKGKTNQIYVIQKVNPKTITIKEIGADARLRASAAILIKVEPGSEEAKAAANADYREYEAAASIPMGAGVVVRAKGVNKSLGEHLYVVLRDKGTDVSLALLGGDPRNRYFPTVPKSKLDVVEHGTF